MKEPEAEKNGAFFRQAEGATEDNPGRVEGEYQVVELKYTLSFLS